MSSKQHRARPSRPAHPMPRVVAASAPATASPEEKVNPAFAGITIINDVPQPHTMPRNYKSYADQGYAANDTIFKCVNYIISNGAAIPPKLYIDRTMQTEITAHPLLDRLARPNNEQDGVTFREAILGWYLITGNAFVYAIRAGKLTGAPDELWVLEANKVHPLPSPTRGIIGYDFDDFARAQNPIPAANIGHLRTWNPKDPIFGLSPIEVAALMIDQQTAARKWDLALLQNTGKPSGAWVTDVVLSKLDRDRLEEAINLKLTGARNAGRVPVIDAGAKWVPNSLPPSELDWLHSLQYNAGQIANIFNMPPQLIGDTSATTYNNMQEAKAASYTEAIFPALDKLYSLLTNWLLPMYPDLTDGKGQPRACLYYDKTTVEVVQETIQARESAKATRAGQLYMQGVITLNQAQEMQGLPPLGKQGAVYRIGAVLVPADKLDEYAEQSLTTPAAPPLPQPEPLQAAPVATGTPAAPGQPPQPPEQPPTAPKKPTSASTSEGEGDNEDEGEDETPAKKPGAKARKSAADTVAASTTGTNYLLWECDADACEVCLENDAVIVAEGDSFPNGCTSPDDSHRFCKCTASIIAVPDTTTGALADLVAGNATFGGVTLPGGGKLPRGTTLTDEGHVLLPDGTLISPDGVTLPSGARITPDGEVRSAHGHVIAGDSPAAPQLLSPADLTALGLLTIGVIASRHARDAAAQQRQQQGQQQGQTPAWQNADDDDDDAGDGDQDPEDEDEYEDQTGATYAVSTKPAATKPPKHPAVTRRKSRRAAFRTFREETLG